MSFVGSLRRMAAAAFMSLAACGAPVGPPIEGPADVTVELDAFSGLPNPVFALSAAEAGELAIRLRDLPGASLSLLPESRLGYRGFRIHNPGGDGGIPENLFVSGAGVILIGSAHPEQSIHLDRHHVEAWLRALAEDRGLGGGRLFGDDG